MMKSLKAIPAALVALMIALPAAQAQTQTQSAGQVIRDMVFSEVEKRLIRDHYGVDAAQQPSDDSAPEWAVKDGGDDAEADEADDDNGPTKDKAKDKTKGKGNKGKDKAKDKAKGKGNGKSKQMPPGLAKRDELPPGLAKQLKEKGRLPPGIAKRDLPSDLASKLPARDPSQEVTVVDDDVVLVDKATGVILDVIKDVVTNGGAGGATNPDGTLAAPGPQSQDGGSEDNLLDTVLKSIFGGRGQ